jgi:ribosomal protein S3
MKAGYVSDFVIDKAIETVTLKTGVVGIKVQIMLPDTPLPDKIQYHEVEVPKEVIETVINEEKQEEVKVE